MRDLVAKIGSRADRETFMALRFRIEAEAQRVFRALHAIADEGVIDPRGYIVVSFSPNGAVEVILALAAGTDHDAQIQAVIAGCRERLDLNIQCRFMKIQDYEPYAALVRAARAQDN